MTSTTASREWLCYIPDLPNVLEQRLSVRAKHLTDLQPKIEAGVVSFGGAVLARHPEEGETPQMIGSYVLVKANTEEEVREMLTNDVYTKGGAWDMSNAKIYPFRTAVRTAL